MYHLALPCILRCLWKCEGPSLAGHTPGTVSPWPAYPVLAETIIACNSSYSEPALQCSMLSCCAHSSPNQKHTHTETMSYQGKAVPFLHPVLVACSQQRLCSSVFANCAAKSSMEDTSAHLREAVCSWLTNFVHPFYFYTPTPLSPQTKWSPQSGLFEQMWPSLLSAFEQTKNNLCRPLPQCGSTAHMYT